MIRLTLEAKSCMAALLLRETFDSFSFIEGEITTFNKFSIDGFLHKDFFEDREGLDSYSKWADIRNFCYSIIKGKRTPLDFKFIFALSKEETVKILAEKVPDLSIDQVQGLYLNFRFTGTELSCTTGTSLKFFTLDKSLEQAFDQWVPAFFSSSNINWNEC